MQGVELNHQEQLQMIKLWEKKRRTTFRAFCLFSLVLGLEYGLSIPTLLNYIKDKVKAPNPQMWFGIIASTYPLASMIGCLTITKYADHTKNIRLILLATSLFASCGNIIYATPKHQLIVMLGRALQGFADSLISVLFGEIIRNYSREEQLQKLSTFMVFYYTAYIGSPLVITICSGVDFHVFGMDVTVYNFPFLLVSGIWVLIFLTTFFFVTDLSKESEVHQLLWKNKKTLENNSLSDTGKVLDNTELRNNENPLFLVDLLKITEFNYSLLVSYLCGYFSMVFNAIYIPIISNSIYHIQVRFVGLLYTLNACVFGITMLISNRFDHGGSEIYFIILGLCSILIALQAISLSVVSYQFKIFGISMLVLFSISTGAGWSVDQVFLAALLGKIIPLNTQSFAAGVRKTMVNISYVVGGLFAPLVQSYISEHAIILSVCIFSVIIILLCKRKQF
ncbi:uncharacterized protein [Clytia hemisphaerica]|uniref:Major facilitator superfamily (MFS) profile domain-containing protein n=1 Tax=Clytia hemisphaerica TaxID=252671 RepID=A0A7M5V475_9CNID